MYTFNEADRERILEHRAFISKKKEKSNKKEFNYMPNGLMG